MTNKRFKITLLAIAMIWLSPLIYSYLEVDAGAAQIAIGSLATLAGIYVGGQSVTDYKLNNLT